MKAIVRRTALLALVLAPAAAAATAEPGFRSAQIIQTVEPDFPLPLIHEFHEGGLAKVEISLSPEGRLDDWLVVSYTDSRFADLAVAALRQWQYKPALWNGRPVGVCLLLSFDFEVKGIVISSLRDETVKSRIDRTLPMRLAYRSYSLDELDHVPAPVQVHAPPYPRQLADRGVSGDVTVRFYLDEQGNVRMASVAGRPPPELAELAVNTISQWKFQPATRHGRPVLAQLTQVFRFDPARPAI